ncbi:unnamed protein product [Ectocarpus sp. CCAP 1310/34]|nr:unnamed protein product [Ectocarpus sp. CCAP 1310/34]
MLYVNVGVDKCSREQWRSLMKGVPWQQPFLLVIPFHVPLLDRLSSLRSRCWRRPPMTTSELVNLANTLFVFYVHGRRLAETWSLARSGRDWDSFEEKRRSMLEALSGIMSNHSPGNDSSSSRSGGSKSSSYPEDGSRSWVTGERLPEEEEDRFALFLDTVRARTCNGMVLPCSPWNLGRCVSPAQAQTLFEAGDWSFHRKYTFKRTETASLFAGPLLALLLNNLGRFTGEEEATSDQTSTRKKGSVQVYSGEVDTVGGILAALNVTEWAWPPYASNIVLELWRRTEAEALPRVEGGQIGAEKFMRMLYNGRVVKPSFCQREECPLRTYRGHIMQFLVPEDLEEACKPQLHPEGPPSQPSERGRRPPHLERQRKGA